MTNMYDRFSLLVTERPVLYFRNGGARRVASSQNKITRGPVTRPVVPIEKLFSEEAEGLWSPAPWATFVPCTPATGRALDDWRRELWASLYDSKGRSPKPLTRAWTGSRRCGDELE
jgi:hypothetical protein